MGSGGGDSPAACEGGVGEGGGIIRLGCCLTGVPAGAGRGGALEGAARAGKSIKRPKRTMR
jgi:hypothetical protein